VTRVTKLIREIHRRSIWQVLGIYVVGSWLVLQVVDTLAGALNLPDWAPPLALFLLIIGLPIVLATAVIQGVSPPTSGADTGADEEAAGVAGREPAGAASSGAQGSEAERQLFTWKNAILGGVVAFALWGIVAAGWLALKGAPAGLGGTGEAIPSVAALPFDNMSGDPEDAYFTDGIHEEILARLAQIGGLRVISRTSVLEYRDSPKNLQEIAGELAVDHVLEGSVRRSGNRIRVTAQLIDAEQDQHLWAEQYDGELTAENLFDIQGDVAGKIAAALRTELSPEEAERLEARPTDNLEAYEHYLRGLQLRNQGFSPQIFEQMIAEWERAVELDPEFAAAHAALSIAHSEMWWFYYDRTRERLERSEAALGRARDIAPDLPQVLAAEGWYYYHGLLDYARALKAFEAALETLPGDPEPAYGIAAIYRRLGDMETSVAYFKRAQELDPRSATLTSQIGETLGLLRRFDEAVPYLDQAIALSPEFRDPYLDKTWFLVAEGDTRNARELLTAGTKAGAFRPTDQEWIWLETLEGRYNEALSRLDQAPPESLSDPELGESWTSQFVYTPAQQWYATLKGLLGETESERAYWNAAAAHLEPLMLEHPEDPRLHSPGRETGRRAHADHAGGLPRCLSSRGSRAHLRQRRRARCCAGRARDPARSSDPYDGRAPSPRAVVEAAPRPPALRSPASRARAGSVVGAGECKHEDDSTLEET
jgi:TolB-like protein/Flp pilus assembly protein TadD